MKRIFTLIMALAIGLASALAEETNVCIGGIYTICWIPKTIRPRYITTTPRTGRPTENTPI